MNRLSNLDWTLIQTFVSVADKGSLSAAARALKISQPTAGRHIRAAESALGFELFQRAQRSFILSDAGQVLLPAAKEMAKAAARLSLLAEGRDSDLSGVVRITASEIVAHYLLPDILAKIQVQAPNIELEILPTNTAVNLLFRDSDIAVRMYRPTQLDLITRRVGELKLGMFAARSYVAKRGLPLRPEDIGQHDFVGYNDDPAIIDGMRAMGFDVDRSFFKIRCDQQTVVWEMVRAGCGIGITQERVGRADPDMVQVLPDMPLPVLPMWLTAPTALQSNARIRRLFDLLAMGLQNWSDGKP